MARLARILSILLKLSAPLAFVSCSSDKTAQAQDVQGQLVLSDSDGGSTATAAVGQQIKIALQTIGPGEYSTPSISTNNVRFLGASVPSGQNPGGVQQDFWFDAVSAGSAVVTIPHTMRDPFVVTITVQ